MIENSSESSESLSLSLSLTTRLMESNNETVKKNEKETKTIDWSMA